MILLADPRWLLLLPPLFGLAVWAWRDGPFFLGPGRKRVVLAVRLLLITVIVLGLCGLSVALPQGREAVVFVADLSASDASGRTSMEAAINHALQQRPADDVAGVISVGRDAAVEQAPARAVSFSGFQGSINPDYTNLERGLELAGATLPDGYRKRIVLMSDGRENLGDALTVVRLLRDQGIRVDVIPQHVTGGPDVRVDRVDVPSQLHTREQFTLMVTLHSTVNTSTRIDVYRDHALADTRTEAVVIGESQYVFREAALGPGPHLFQVRVTPARDTQPQNNLGSALTTVQGAPRVLVVAAVPLDAANVLRSLNSTGIQTDLQEPARLQPTLAYLQRYAAVVIVNTPAVAFDPAVLAQLVPYVRDLGRGLVLIGGQDAYGLGGYGGTPLEQVLPVKMDLPRRRQIPSVAVALIIESLEAPLPVNISKQAGTGVIKLLTEQDEVAVNSAPDNGTSGWVVPLQHPRDKAAMYTVVSRMVPGDPNTYSMPLRSGYLMLKQSHARIKHIILLGDGDARDPAYGSLVRAIRAGGVTVSTVVTNAVTSSDFRTMRDIARWGGGRYYQADDPSNVPRLFLREAHTVAHSGVVAGKFYPRRVSTNPIVSDLHRVPPLYGYVATAAKPTAEVVLASRKLDPVLATWQFGLGRAAAWTSDAAGLWTRDWLAAPSAGRFWSNLVSWTFPSSTGSPLYISVTSEGGSGRISITTPPGLGSTPSVTARVVSPDLHTSSVGLQISAPGQYGGSFPATSQGAYFVSVVARGGRHVAVGQAGVAVPYSAEYQTIGTDMAFLQALARAGGGVVESGPQSAWQGNLAPVYDQRSMTDVLWFLALLLLPVDVALRRVVFGRSTAWVLQPARSRQRKPAVGAVAAWSAMERAARRLPGLRAEGNRAVSPPERELGRSPTARLHESAPRTSSSIAVVPPRVDVDRSAQSTASRLLEVKRRKQAAREGTAP